VSKTRESHEKRRDRSRHLLNGVDFADWTSAMQRPTNTRTRGIKVSAGPLGWKLAVLLTMVLVPAGSVTHAQVPVATIRTYDYAAIPSDRLERAQAAVSAIYARIGLALKWEPPCRPAVLATGVCRHRTDLSVIVPSPAMATQMDVPDHVLGLAPGTRTQRGRIAYVFHHRVQSLAEALPRDAAELMAVVMAHEIGHLLLPHGSHAAAGLMRGRWSNGELERIALGELRMSARHARHVRRGLERMRATEEGPTTNGIVETGR
jgi:hypothetical protein